MLVIGGQEQLTHRREVQRCPASNGPDDLHAGALAVSAFNIDNFVTLADTQVDGLLNDFVQFPHRYQGCVVDAQPAFHHVAQFEQAHAQAVTTCLGAFHKSTYGQVIQNAVSCGWVQSSLFGNVFE